MTQDPRKRKKEEKQCFADRGFRNRVYRFEQLNKRTFKRETRDMCSVLKLATFRNCFSLRGKRVTHRPFLVYRDCFKHRISCSLVGKHVTCTQSFSMRVVYHTRLQCRFSCSLSGKRVTHV